MTRRPTVVRRAPGKLFVAGEYAVVEPGNPAILIAVDRYVTVTVSDPGDPGVALSSDLTPYTAHCRWRDGRIDGAEPRDAHLLRESFAHVAAAVETVGRLLAERGLPEPALDISVSSELHDNGTKFGFGSSGAVVVATVAALAAHCGLHLTRDARYRLAMLATAGLEPRASGGDLAAGTWGGWIAYRAPDRAAVLDLAARAGVEEALRVPWPGHDVRRLPQPAALSLEVGWTGTPASTSSLVSGLDRKTWRGSASHRRFVETSNDFVHAAADALDRADHEGLLRQIRRARGELARIDEEAGLGIFTPRLTALCDAAEAVGGAAKPSGAGGGDCGIALLDADAALDIAQVRKRWATAGVRPLPIRPAMEGNEE
ncbi:phosphomevalonate kinase [Streptomyces sp. NPDC050732]|uniref:phosphomevalonate kinase n=1 Tax=Streptomyces sp. NPDC050732 TaxID=3154632 RepID=UPI00342748EE